MDIKLLNLSYNLKLFMWQVRETEEKSKAEFEKNRLQHKFIGKLRMMV